MARRGLLSALPAVLVGGCELPTQAPVTQRAQAPIGVAYSVETAALLAEEPLATVVAHDFANIKGVGLETVLLRHVEADDLPTLLTAAEGACLDLIVPDTGAIEYVRSGRGGSPGFEVGAVPRHPRIAGRYLGRVVDEVTLERAMHLASVAHGMQPPLRVCVTVDNRGLLGRRDVAAAFDYVVAGEEPFRSSKMFGATQAVGIAVVDCRYAPEERGAAVRAWLRNYHAALLAGQSGGVLFDAYRVLPGRWEAVSTGGARLSPERITMLKRIVARAEHWSPLLAGLQRSMVSSAFGDHPDLATAVFANDKRRCLLLVNTSTERFVRSEVSVPADIGARPIQRAVRVADADSASAGEVIEARRSILEFRVDLAPGDAALYELF